MIKNERGQMTLEMILIAIILTGIAISFSNAAKSNGYLASLVEGPWLHVRGMIEDGVWVAAGDNSKALNPHHLSRHASYEGDNVP